MHKKLFILLFTIFISSNLFAESHNIHNQITDLTERINQLENDVKTSNLEDKIEKLDFNNKNIDVTIKNDLKPLLSELIKLNQVEKKEKSWSPSDWGTVAIAFLTFLLVLFTGISVWLLLKQNKEQESTNKDNLDLLKSEHEENIRSIRVNQVENQIIRKYDYINKVFIENRYFHENFLFELAKHNGCNSTSYSMRQESENMIFTDNTNGKLYSFKKYNTFEFISNLLIDLGKRKTNQLVSSDINVIIELKNFHSQITYLLILLNEAYKLGYSNILGKHLLNNLTTYVEICVNVGIMKRNEYNTFLYFAMFPFKNDFSFSIKIQEQELIQEIRNKFADLRNLEESDCEITTQDFTNTNYELFLIFIVELKNESYNLKRDENNIWSKI